MLLRLGLGNNYNITSELFIPAWSVKIVDDPSKPTMEDIEVIWYMSAALDDLYSSREEAENALKKTRKKKGEAAK